MIEAGVDVSGALVVGSVMYNEINTIIGTIIMSSAHHRSLLHAITVEFGFTLN